MFLELGDAGPITQRWREVMNDNFGPLYTELLGSLPCGPGWDTFGPQAQKWQKEYERRTGQPQDGIASEQDLEKLGLVFAHRPIWIYTAPGSGADWWLGPSFDLGERCKNVLHLNHQPLSFRKGGYLGLLGGDPSFSYVEVTYDQYKSLEYNLDNNPDIHDPNVELWFSGYSQSADGMEDALEVLFGDGGFIHPGDPTQTPSPPGKYRHLRSRINGLIQFGNPSTKGTGIARKVRPAWLDALVRNVNYPNDFYAVATDAIRPPMYAIIVQAEMELPFFVHVLRLAARIIPDWLTFLPLGGLGGLLGGAGAGGAFGPLAQLSVGAMTGLAGNPALGQLMGMAGVAADKKVDDDLYNLLKPTGVLSNIPGLIALVGALPGLQAHGGYPFDPVMMDRAYDHIAGFRR